MPAYAVAHIRSISMGPDIVRYLEEIDSTLAPFGGRYLVHGSTPQPVEGVWSGDLVILEFPDLDRAREWYASAAYQRILPLRTNHSAGEVILVDGVAPEHRATDILAA